MKNIINKSKLCAVLGSIIVLHHADNVGRTALGAKKVMSASHAPAAPRAAVVDQNALIMKGLSSQLDEANAQIAQIQSDMQNQYGVQAQISSDLQDQIQALVEENIKAKNLSKKHEEIAISVAVAATTAAILAYMVPKVIGMIRSKEKGLGKMWNDSVVKQQYKDAFKFTTDKVVAAGRSVGRFVNENGIQPVGDFIDGVIYSYPKKELREAVKLGLIKGEELKSANILLGMDGEVSVGLGLSKRISQVQVAIKELVTARIFEGANKEKTYESGQKVKLSENIAKKINEKKMQLEQASLKEKHQSESNALSYKQSKERADLKGNHEEAIKKAGGNPKKVESLTENHKKQAGKLDEKHKNQTKKLDAKHTKQTENLEARYKPIEV